MGTPSGDERVVLVHGAVTAGRETWGAQQELAGAYDLVVPDRQGYDPSGPEGPDDPVVDAATIADLLDDGAHLVGYSMGGMVALLAAARRPEAVRSLVLIEPGAFDLVRGRDDVEHFISAYRAVADGAEDAETFLRDFLVMFGNPAEEVAGIPDPMPAELHHAAVAQFTGTDPWDVPTPVDEIAAGGYPVVIVSGGHSEMFDAVCDVLAERVGATREVVPGAGHAAQFTGEPFNDLLRRTWSDAGPRGQGLQAQA